VRRAIAGQIHLQLKARNKASGLLQNLIVAPDRKPGDVSASMPAAAP
jgi:hypothetical protein